MSKPKDPSIKVALNDFCVAMDELALECEMEIYEVHRGEDRLWDSLWDHPKLWSLFIGVSAAVLPIAGLMAWHISRGGTLF